MRDCQDDWKIPVIHKEVPTRKEAEAWASKTPAGDNVVPKNMKPIHKPTQQKKGSVPKKDV
jgi:hypothetical protein